MPIGPTSYLPWGAPSNQPILVSQVLSCALRRSSLKCHQVGSNLAGPGIYSMNLKARSACAILVSLYHIMFGEFSHAAVQCTRPLQLISNTCTMLCTPGLRALIHVLTAQYWKGSPTINRTAILKGDDLPLEIRRKTLSFTEPRDSVSFAQASPAIEQACYLSTPSYAMWKFLML